MGKAENYVEHYLRDRVKRAGGVCWKFTSATSGVPDRIIVLNGHTVFVETKAPGKSLDPLQRVRRDEILASGGDARKIDNRDDVDLLIDELTLGRDLTSLERKTAA